MSIRVYPPFHPDANPEDWMACASEYETATSWRTDIAEGRLLIIGPGHAPIAEFNVNQWSSVEVADS